MNTQEHHQKMNVGLGHRKTQRLSCQGVPNSCEAYFGGQYDENYKIYRFSNLHRTLTE